MKLRFPNCLYSILLAVATFVIPAYAKYEVCTVTINSAQEAQTFRQKLGEQNFNYTELTDFSDATTGEDGWFDVACKKGIACDVVLISGHFGGDFTGTRNLGLKLSDMDHNSCQHRCDGILNHPKEVYLFGCNTLAAKNQEHRTPAQYLAAQLHAGYGRTEAERHTAELFSPFGSTYRERMEAVFEGVTRIYGFDAIAPSGASVRSSVREYLDHIGDFKKHLDGLNENSETRTWMNAMRHYNVAHSRGIKPTDAGYPLKTNLCAIEDESQPLADRATLAFDLLKQDSNFYLPEVSRFVNRDFGNFDSHALNPQDLSATQDWLKSIYNRQDLRSIFLDALNSSAVTDSIRVDLLVSVHDIGWIDQWEFETEMNRIFAPYVSKPTNDSSDFICSQLKENPGFLKYIDVSQAENYSFTDAYSFTMARCLNVTDTAVRERALSAFYQNRTHFRAGELEAALGWLKTFPNFDQAKASSVHAVNEHSHRVLMRRYRRLRRR